MGWTEGPGRKYDTYLKVGEIKGEVKEPAHRSWIKLKSVNPKEKEISVVKAFDSTSLQLVDLCASGKHAGLVVVDYVREDGGVSLRFEISDALISSIATGPIEQVVFEGKVVRKQVPGTPAR